MFKKSIQRYRFNRKKDKDGNLVNIRPIDQFNAQPFNYGVNGLPASDITLLARATSQKEYELVLSRLREIRVQQPDNSNKTDAQIALEIMPSWVQTPSEVSSFLDYMKAVVPTATFTSQVTEEVKESVSVDPPETKSE